MPTVATSLVQVMYSHALQSWFVREDGRTHPSDFAHVSAQFGTPFAEACLHFSGEWIDYDGEVTSALEDAIDAFDELVTPKPVTTAVRMPNPAAWGKAAAL